MSFIAVYPSESGFMIQVEDTMEELEKWIENKHRMIIHKVELHEGWDAVDYIDRACIIIEGEFK